MVWNKQESRRKYWATRSSVRSFARTAHSWEGEFLMSQNDLILSHSGVVGGGKRLGVGAGVEYDRDFQPLLAPFCWKGRVEKWKKENRKKKVGRV